MSDKLKFIAKKCEASVSLTYREHADYYEKLSDEVTYERDGNGEYYHCSNFLDGELEKCLETDEYWCLQFYPNSPVGFFYAFSHDLDKLLDWAVDILEKDDE